MDAKEIKSALKEAKENLDAKDFKSAVRRCKAILKSDRNNYLALVFFGAALQETDQKDEAPKAFKKAIEVSPNQLLAWRGLLSCYEKFNNENQKQDLIKVYEKLLVLETDSVKFSELAKKYEKLAVMCDESNVKNLFSSLQSLNEEKTVTIKQLLVAVISSFVTISNDILPIYQRLLNDLLSLTPRVENYADLSKKYLKHLYKQGNLKEVLKLGNDLIALFPDDISILEWICKVYSELTCESHDEEFDSYSAKEAYLHLIKIMPESQLGFLCKGAYESTHNDLLNGVDSLTRAAKLKPNSGLSWFLLCRCQILLQQFPESETSAVKSIQFLEKSEKHKECVVKSKIWLVQSLSEQKTDEKCLKAVKLGTDFFKKNPEEKTLLPYLARSLITLQKYEDARYYLSQLNQDSKLSGIAEFLESLILKSQGKIAECKSKLADVVKSHPDLYEAWLELGKIYYAENEPESCLSSLLKSTKLNQWCFSNFLYLGHCYKNMMTDFDKARRCYQKAFQLNPKCIEAGMCLSDVYRVLSKEDMNMKLLSSATSQSPDSKWAWLKLGLHYLATNQQLDAISSLQVAVRLDSTDKTCWECLGDAYLSQGSYTSALKSYQKVTELDPSSIYPLLQIATVKHLIGSFVESINEFRIVMDLNPGYLPAKKGLAEACLSLMREHLAQNLNGLAADACQEAVSSLVGCLDLRKDLICVWKLLGDACVLLSGLPDKYCQLNVANWLCSDTKIEDKQVTSKLKKPEILQLASRSYCHAVALNPGSLSLWYDLAIAYNELVDVKKTFESKKQMRHLALSAAKKSTQTNAASWEGWNLLGVIYSSLEIQNYPLAQHSFIKALSMQDTAVAWTNLGTLYLCLGDLHLANQSFTEAQKCDPDYVQCWVGQALLAEMTSHHETMDLFRHSTQLGTFPEASLGYANMVCTTLLSTTNKLDINYIYSIKNMNAITVACDAVNWYTDRIIDNPCAFNMLGLLLERQQLHRRSAEAFRRALILLEAEKVSKENEEKHSDKLDKVLLNYGRVLVNLRMYDDALDHLKRIKKATFANQCGISAAYFKAGRYEEAYSSYETTLEWLAPNRYKSHILVAMAAVLYLYQGQEDAKILLMQACQLKPPSVQGLFACCALGMLHGNLPLSELSLKELVQYKDDPSHLAHIGVFQAYTHLFQGNNNGAIRALCKMAHRHPNQPSLWLSLSLLLLHLYPNCSSHSAARCAQIAMSTGRSSIDVSKVMSLVSLSHLLSGEGLSSLRSSQKAVHMFPDVTENWIVLVASVLSRCLVRESPKDIIWLKKIITYVRRKLQASKSMTQWLSNNDRKVSLMAEKIIS